MEIPMRPLRLEHRYVIADPSGAAVDMRETDTLLQTNLSRIALLVEDGILRLTHDISVGGHLFFAGHTVLASVEAGKPGYILSLDAPNRPAQRCALTRAAFPAGGVHIFEARDIDSATGQSLDPDAVCFVGSARIETPTGPVAVDTLVPGSFVTTRDAGPQLVCEIEHVTLPALGADAPVAIDKGLFGASQAQLAAPTQRLLIEGALPELLIGTAEVLVTARDLRRIGRVKRCETGFVRYVRLVLSRPYLVRVDGIWSETEGLSGEAGDLGRPILCPHEARLLT